MVTLGLEGTGGMNVNVNVHIGIGADRQEETFFVPERQHARRQAPSAWNFQENNARSNGRLNRSRKHRAYAREAEGVSNRAPTRPRTRYCRIASSLSRVFRGRMLAR